ncbi:MAG: IS4 family transposase [Chitinophagaceae bacterium]
MNKSKFFTGQPIFTQIVKFLPRNIIIKASNEFRADRYCKKFDTYHHLITMLDACYQHCTSLREVSTGMSACGGRLQSLGVHYLPARSTLSEANKRRSYLVVEKICYGLYHRYKHVLPDSHSDRLSKQLVIIDSTTISLFKEILENAGRRNMDGRKKGGIKVHMAVRAHEDVPYLVDLTKASQAAVSFLHKLHLPEHSVLVMDRGYNNFRKFHEWSGEKINWVARTRVNAVIEVKKERSVSDAEKHLGVLRDQNIVMGFKNKAIQQVKCRLVRYFDAETNKTLEFVTNNYRWKPSKVAAIYKRRWQIELLFKRLKQNMPLQYFLGDNENAVKVQIYAALIADLLLKLIVQGVKRKWSFSNMAGIVRLHLMNYTDLRKFLENPERCRIINPVPNLNPQLTLNLSG